ncbi:MAG: 3-deoxy-manno-octulosonate cytidylyltransferase [Candidatus Scalindua sp. AMX11]|nr:MAG: 3-deoxy-manno-octulosonate cytidylyltransferase [Candidatus Scalindua sp.]RZV88006.1 MAG: 3-deoxy-manno-octulosonate cytidylyltransferase [Candidatus Scalindua sp. SCAELEC01]TDE64154.1 MAG: 3-deoxy-manno-octulosonate cytidylyltransferase [Candidatus Scalindua sp. AMX11]GJQ58416.1 MAG: 3-deoxy-manno-octulosonate cytidylyltransferase [Candidatus Scalindua sp.]
MDTFKTIAIIPARYASTRLPGKLIKYEAKKYTGKFLIEHVYEKVKTAKQIQEVIIAADDERIVEAVNTFSGTVKMTSSNHESGTDRIAEVASHLDVDYVVNVQGDEPDIRGDMIDNLVETMYAEKEAAVCTLANVITSQEELMDPNVVKIVLDDDNYALYFSRAPIPYVRDNEDRFAFTTKEKREEEIQGGTKKNFSFLKHLGIYVYRRDFLLTFSSLCSAGLEDAEKLEQLRVLSNGYKIKVIVTPYTCEGVDTPGGFERFIERYRIRKS